MIIFRFQTISERGTELKPPCHNMQSNRETPPLGAPDKPELTQTGRQTKGESRLQFKKTLL